MAENQNLTVIDSEVIWGQSENSVASNKPMHTILLI